MRPCRGTRWSRWWWACRTRCRPGRWRWPWPTRRSGCCRRRAGRGGRRCGAREDFARKGKRTRPRKLHTAAGTVELILWHVGCRGCGRNFAPLLVILGLSGKRRTDRLSLDLAELGTQMSFARAGRVDAELAGTSATAGQAHNALADVAALLTGGPEPDPDDDPPVAAGPHEPDEPDADRPEDDQPAVADADADDEPGDGQPGGDQPGGDQPGAAAAGWSPPGW